MTSTQVGISVHVPGVPDNAEQAILFEAAKKQLLALVECAEQLHQTKARSMSFYRSTSIPTTPIDWHFVSGVKFLLDLQVNK